MLREHLIPHVHNVMRDTLEQTFTEMMSENKSFIIWGAGQTGAMTIDLLNNYSKGKLVPKYIVDNNSSLWGTHQIISPTDFFAEMEQIDAVLVCVYVADQVIAQLKENGYTGQIIPVNISVFAIDDKLLQFYDENMDNLESLYSLVADDRSRKTIEAYLNVIRSGDIRFWDAVNGDSTVKLLDPEVLHFSYEEHFVDVGAFTGDTISKYLELCDGKYLSILGFEPDTQNFSALQNYVASNQLANTHLFPMAVSNEEGMRLFYTGRSESGFFSSTEGENVPVTMLDSVLEAKNTTMLKISTNGFDLDVIKGAQNLILKNKPQISAYANRNLLWEIPFYLKELVPEYEIYYRHYGIGRQAMICYAKIREENK